MNKITLYLFTILFLFSSADLCARQKKKEKEISDREIWYKIMYRMAAPVLSNMSEGKLQENMQLELSPTWDGRDKLTLQKALSVVMIRFGCRLTISRKNAI